MVFRMSRGRNSKAWFICGYNDRKYERVANPYSNIMTFLTQFTLSLGGAILKYFYVVRINQHSNVPPVDNWKVLSSNDGCNCGVHPPPKVYVVMKP
jgi:hypothetical protein